MPEQPTVPESPVDGTLFHNERVSSGSDEQPAVITDIHRLENRNESPDSAGEPVPTPILTSVRFRLAIICWFGFAVLYAQRTNLSIAMVCMVKSVAYNASSEAAQNSHSTADCPELEHGDKAGFDWDKNIQGQILGSFFYGYLVLQIPGGMLSERFGAARVVTIGMIPVAVLTLLTPILTRVHYVILLVIRVVLGLGEAVMYPAASALWGKWSPPLERSMLVGISLSGGQFGNAFVLPVGGILCAELGWESIFYVIGGFGTLFCIIWMAWVNPTPDTHKGLSKAEKLYLERTVPTVTHKDKNTNTPWKAIFTSVPFWAIMIAHTCGNYTYYMNLTQIPTYMKEVLKFNIKANGAYSMLPYLVFWLSTMGAGVLSDFIISKKVPMLVVRKSFAVLGLMGPAVFLVATAYVDCHNKYIAIFTLCCAVGFTGFAFASYMINHADLAPDYAGTLFGITNTTATLPGFIAPIIVGLMTPDGTAKQWQYAFFVAAAINVVGAAVYVFFARCTIQPWSSAHEKGKANGAHEDVEVTTSFHVQSRHRSQLQALQKTQTIRRVSTTKPM